MGIGKYSFILIVMLVTFLALIDLVFALPVARYQFLLILVFMFFAFLIVVGVYFDAGWSYWLGSLFFGLNLLNLIYLYFRVSSYSLVWYAVGSALGFIVCVSAIKSEEEEFAELDERNSEIDRQIGQLEEETPKVEIIRDEKR